MKLKQMKNQELKEHGVTLVALVVTIVIMLILAGVALRLSLGDNGLISMAKKATDKYKNAQSNEEYYLDTVTNTIEDVRESMHKLTAEELSENPKKYYGSYVNYGVDLDGNSETSDWKLFYVGGSDTNDSDDVKGRIYLIAADYVPMNHSALKGVVAETEEGESNTGLRRATGEGYGTLSAYWGSSAPAYQPLDKLNPNPIKLFMHEGYDLSSKSDNPNSAATSTLLNTDNWSGFVNKVYYGEVAIGGPTLEMWCKAWNQVVDETDTINNLKKIYANGASTSGSGYYWGIEKETKNRYGVYLNGTLDSPLANLTKLGKDYPVFFPHTTISNVTANGVMGNCSGYWLASPSANDSSHVMAVNYNSHIRGWEYYGGWGLRPLVCLEKDVKLQKNTEKSNDTKIVYDIVK